MTVHLIQNNHNSGDSTEKMVARILGLGRIECTVPIMVRISFAGMVSRNNGDSTPNESKPEGNPLQ